MIIYGWNPVHEAVRSHPDRIRYIAIAREQRGRLGRLIEEARRKGVVIRQLSTVQLARLVERGAVHNGVVAEIGEAEYADFETAIGHSETTFVFLLDGVRDPRNLGAILRVADGFGVDLVVLPEHESAGMTAVTIKAAAGASEWVPVTQVTNLSRAIERLKEEGFWIYAADFGGQDPVEVDFRGKVAIVLGGEGSGIRRNVREHCDGVVSIPLRGQVESLNVSTAAAVLGWEIDRQRRQGASGGDSERGK